MKNAVIKVGFLVSYDWEFLKTSMPLVYKDADIIYLAIDNERTTWSGNKFEFDKHAFDSFIKSIDVENKIHVYEDNFHLPDLNSIENDTRERNLLSKAMGNDGWHLQIDADEYFLDFPSFKKFLLNLNPNPKFTDKPVNVSVNVIPIIKQLDSGFIYVKFPQKNYELFPIATTQPEYISARVSNHFNILSDSFIFHQTQARSGNAFMYKLQNWGHNLDFKIKSHYKIWEVLDEYNYKYIKNFNAVGGETWPELDFCPAESISDLISQIQKKEELSVSPMKRFFKNNRNIQRILSRIR